MRYRCCQDLGRLLRLLVVGTVILVAAGGWAEIARTYIYPYTYRSAIEENAAAHRIDPYLVAAVIKNESKFQPTVRSDRGAVGLMQLMPQTAEWIAWRMEEPFAEEALEEPAHNIRYGVWYLDALEQEFGGNDILALAAYNAGLGNVRDWMERYHWNDNFDEIDAIPYPETRLYVRRVLEDRARYKRLYEDE